MLNRRQQTLVAIIAGSIGIALILTVAWFYTKQFRMTRYTSKKYGFSLKYPADWSVVENRDGVAAVFLSPPETELDRFRENAAVVIQNISDISAKPMDLTQYTQVAIRQMRVVFDKYLEVVESEPDVLSGYPAHRFVFIGRGPDGTELQMMIMWTLVDNVGYQIAFSAGTIPKYEEFMPRVEGIFRSFRIK
jgi:hypothetical protein